MAVAAKDERQQRPWTVVLLVAWTVLGALWPLAFDDARGLNALGYVAIGVLFAFALWKGIGWVYVLWGVLLTFGVLGALISIVSLVVSGGETLQGRPGPGSVAWTFLLMVGPLALMWHPATKRFAGIARPDRTLGLPNERWTEIRHGRVLLSLTLVVFGALAVGTPFLWAMGRVDGGLLAGLVAATLLSGIAVIRLQLRPR